MPGIYIDDELTKDIEINESITEELRNQGVRAFREGNVDAAMEVGNADDLLRPQLRLMDGTEKVVVS